MTLCEIRSMKSMHEVKVLRSYTFIQSLAYRPSVIIKRKPRRNNYRLEYLRHRTTTATIAPNACSFEKEAVAKLEEFVSVRLVPTKDVSRNFELTRNNDLLRRSEASRRKTSLSRLQNVPVPGLFDYSPRRGARALSSWRILDQDKLGNLLGY